jgi:hypothetical protein
VSDRREEILQRLMAILASLNTIPLFGGTPGAFRNRGQIPPDKLPALVLLDGIENQKISTEGKGGAKVPTVYTLEPQIFILLRPRETIENAGVGEELSTMRAQVLKAIIYDDSLNNLLGANGEVNYDGHDSDLQNGNAMEGAMQLRLRLMYVFDPRIL